MRKPAIRTLRRAAVVCLPVSVLLGLAAGCKAPPAAPPSRLEVQPEIQKALIDAHTSLIDAYEAGDVERFVSLLDPSNDLLIFHPMSEDRFESVAEVREKMSRMFAKIGKVTWTDAHPVVIQRGDIAWITSNFLLDSPDLDYHFIGRGTEIWVRDGNRWQLIHAHWSKQPDTRD